MQNDNTRDGSIAPLAHPVPAARTKLGGCSTSHIYRLVERGKLDAIKIGKRTLITDASITTLIATAPRLVIKRGRPKKVVA